MAAGMDSAKRFAIRATLVAGSTVAVIVGAQTLMTVDAKTGTFTQNSRNTTSSEITNSGVSVLRQPDESSPFHSDDDESFEHDGEHHNQRNSFFGTQQNYRTPRTGSSR